MGGSALSTLILKGLACRSATALDPLPTMPLCLAAQINVSALNTAGGFAHPASQNRQDAGFVPGSVVSLQELATCGTGAPVPGSCIISPGSLS